MLKHLMGRYKGLFWFSLKPVIMVFFGKDEGEILLYLIWVEKGVGN